jgi:hypothetical protein
MTTPMRINEPNWLAGGLVQNDQIVADAPHSHWIRFSKDANTVAVNFLDQTDHVFIDCGWIFNAPPKPVQPIPPIVRRIHSNGTIHSQLRHTGDAFGRFPAHCGAHQGTG